MRGVILGGGFGTRMRPVTEAINKHLLPVAGLPMIFHPINSLVEAGIKELLVVCGGNCSDGFLTLLKDGKHLGLERLYYTYQVGAGGIAEALALAEDFITKDTEPFAVVLGDNIFSDSIKPQVKYYLDHHKGTAQIHLISVKNPQDFGCPKFEDTKLVDIIEKPKDPPSNYAVTGLYFYPQDVFQIIKTLKRSERGELEVTDINRAYLKQDRLHYRFLEGEWTDAGKWDSYLRANLVMSKDG